MSSVDGEEAGEEDQVSAEGEEEVHHPHHLLTRNILIKVQKKRGVLGFGVEQQRLRQQGTRRACCEGIINRNRGIVEELEREVGSETCMVGMTLVEGVEVGGGKVGALRVGVVAEA